jgi:hypothetical protein
MHRRTAAECNGGCEREACELCRANPQVLPVGTAHDE